MTNLFVIAFFGFTAMATKLWKELQLSLSENIKYSNFTGGKWAFFNNSDIFKLEQGAIFKLEQSGQVFSSFSPCPSLPSAASENNCLKYSSFFCNSMGRFHEAVRSTLLDSKRLIGGRKTKEILHPSKSWYPFFSRSHQIVYPPYQGVIVSHKGPLVRRHVLALIIFS